MGFDFHRAAPPHAPFPPAPERTSTITGGKRVSLPAEPAFVLRNDCEEDTPDLFAKCMLMHVGMRFCTHQASACIIYFQYCFFLQRSWATKKYYRRCSIHRKLLSCSAQHLRRRVRGESYSCISPAQSIFGRTKSSGPSRRTVSTTRRRTDGNRMCGYSGINHKESRV